MTEELKVVGQRLPRWAAYERVTGAARYSVDIKLPGMLVGKVLTSPYAHARIVSIDTSKAKKLPGVEVIITHKDVPQKPFNRSMMEYIMYYPQGELKNMYVLTDKARFVGDAIAAVAAVDAATAQEALSLIDVKYEVLPAVFDPLESMKQGAPILHEPDKSNVLQHFKFPASWGDVAKGFKESDLIVEATFRTSKQHVAQLEPCTCIASLDASGVLTVWSPSQQIFLLRRKLADIFNMPEGKIRAINAHVGGSFGKYNSFGAEPICVALALKAHKPVKLEYSREEDFFGTETREAYIETGKIGVKKDGTINALKENIIVHGGSYFTHAGTTTTVNMGNFLALYRCPNVDAEADVVYTNVPTSGGNRGYGMPEAMFLLEQLIDMTAEKLGMDPLELRLKNMKKMGDYTGAGLQFETVNQEKCVKIGAEKIGWKEKKARKKDIGIKKRGVGMSIFFDVSGGQPFEIQDRNIEIRLNEDGSANLLVGAVDMGTNLMGTCAQIAAEVLGLRYEDIHVVNGDTDSCPFDMGVNANCGAYQVGGAVFRAASEVKKQILERAAQKLGVSITDLDVRDGKVVVTADPSKNVTIAEISKEGTYNFKGQHLHITGKGSYSPTKNPPPTGAVFAEVEVDTETGEVKVLKLVHVQDSGRAINPATVEGQLEGGIALGIGYTLYEDYYIDTKTGELQSDNYNTYRVPNSIDVPEIEVALVEDPTPSGPFGAKGVGMSGVIGVAPAIANAIYDAVGVRVSEMPITPEKVLQALKSR